MDMPMTNRERLLTTLAHREPDRIPLGYDAWHEIDKQLFARYGVSDRLGLFAAMGIDGFSVFEDNYAAPRFVGPKRKTPDGRDADMYGGAGQEFCPLAFAESVADLDRHELPRVEWFDFSAVRSRCDAIHARGDVTVGGEGGCGIQHAINMRGYERALMDPLAEPAFTHAYMERLAAFMHDWNESWLAAGAFDIFRCGDELGSMTTMHCSPAVWREFYKPYLAHAWAPARRRGLHIWFHCCGYLRPCLEDLIEMGVTMWDPAPPTVRDNDLPELKRRYGKQITFVGGVDQPRVLVEGTVADVQREVRLRIEQLAPGGGYVLGPSQVFTGDVPIDNIVAMYETALKHGRY